MGDRAHTRSHFQKSCYFFTSIFLNSLSLSLNGMAHVLIWMCDRRLCKSIHRIWSYISTKRCKYIFPKNFEMKTKANANANDVTEKLQWNTEMHCVRSQVKCNTHCRMCIYLVVILVFAVLLLIVDGYFCLHCWLSNHLSSRLWCVCVCVSVCERPQEMPQSVHDQIEL